MIDLYQYLTLGFVFGLSAGISPGPFLTLIINQTIKHNITEGAKVAIAPVITDIPIMLVSVFILSKLSNVNIFLSFISLAGAIFLTYLGMESLKTSGIEINSMKTSPRSLQKGIITNALNPHPYIFFFTVGGPLIIKAYKINPYAPIVFFGSFTTTLIVTEIMLAFVVGRSRSFLKSNLYVYTVRFMGLILLTFAVLFLKEGLGYLGL